ncbi:MAG: 2-succinyl-6-hydroxy-2,4-cyclohexadiene-1-carboxylate synthase [Dehalococcoidia bacterium]
MPYVEVDGLPINVDKIGNGPPVVLLHGFTGEGRSLRPLVWALDRDFTTISLDLVGHAMSGSPIPLERYEMRRAVDDLVEVLRSFGFERAAWFGYSLGGRIALQVAVHRPDAVSALVLEGASPGRPAAAARAARRAADEALADRIEAEGVEAFVDYWESLPLWGSQRETLTDEQREALRKQRLTQRAKGLANSLRGMGTGAQEWVGDRLGEMRVPVLLTAGSLDAKFAATAQEMAGRLPEATVQLIEGAGHAAHLERPDEFNATVRAFLMQVRDRV